MTTTPRASVKTNRLTSRDVDVLDSLSTARMLTIEALEWLHVANWRERWERQTAAGDDIRYRPATYLYERMHFLLREQWVLRFRRSIQMASERFGREADVYLLSEQGARVLSEVRYRPLEEITFTRSRPRSYFTLSHGVEIGMFYAALRAKMAMSDGVTMEAWAGEHLTAKGYDRIMVRRMGKQGLEQVKLPIQPDATFLWKHPNGVERIFVEIDRGTRSLATWIEKIQAYQAYMGSPELKARYDTDSFMVLTVAPTERQQRALMQATASVLGKAHGRYLFCLKDTIHPMRIGHGWQKISSVTPTSNSLKPSITVEPHPLLR